ncbi:hypothetical protein QMZ92_19200 [Streptomyces sp. HNM0645]|uniref:hypothetical protein n=1 Tax=Streptomyces sp. HNM0645 TaxID=2782343 RepID=UPI0024B6FC26|nr:hypothetical protein [Streptomyces sp. HNM0645]MDI9886443.1 hypothetical protein [Streptomyces sp. HNM0645]
MTKSGFGDWNQLCRRSMPAMTVSVFLSAKTLSVEPPRSQAIRNTAAPTNSQA